MNLSQQMTLLGLAAMVFYAILLATGTVGTDVMPQFMVSAIVFLSSGRLMRGTARKLPRKEKVDQPAFTERDWNLFNKFLNWFMTLLIVGGMALWLLKPVGVSFVDAYIFHDPPQHSYHSDPAP